MVTKKEAIQRLRDAGFVQQAKELDRWRDKGGKNRGWDGWIRGAYPPLVTVTGLAESPPRNRARQDNAT